MALRQNKAVQAAYDAGIYTDKEGTEWRKGMDGWFDRSVPGHNFLLRHHSFIERVEKEHPEDEAHTSEEFDFVAAREDPARLEKMKPVLDRIPEQWGKYLPEVGWDAMLLELDAKLAEIDPDYAIHQAKQKFGQLRFYTATADGVYVMDSEFERLIREAESKSYTVCEYCGGEGKLRQGGWISVLCDDHTS